MNFIHFHLMMNHLPLVGSGIGLMVLAVALLRRSDELKQAALVIFILAALVAIPTYLTGEQAETQVQKIPVIAREAVLRHDDAAAWALGANEVLGGLSLIGLILMRRHQAPRRLIVTIMVAAAIVGGLMAYTASLGGRIRHPEINRLSIAPTLAGAGQATQLALSCPSGWENVSTRGCAASNRKPSRGGAISVSLG